MRRTLSALGVAGALLAAAAVVVPAVAAQAGPDPRAERPGAAERPLVIGHRGASGYRRSTPWSPTGWPSGRAPTSSSRTWSSTKDGILVARHENEISRYDRRGGAPRVRRPPGARRPSTGWR